MDEFERKLKRKYGKAGAMSLICMDNKGEWGIATNVEFTFVVATDTEEPTTYMAAVDASGKVTVERAGKEWLEDYLAHLNDRVE